MPLFRASSILVLSLLLPLSLWAQDPDSLATATLINEQVWHPFREAWGARHPTSFNALHTDDVIRAGSWGMRIGEEYKQNNEATMPSFDGPQRAIDFTFEQRVFRENVAYEVGYYRITVWPKRQEEQHYYGYFHVVLRKEGDTWKIAQDWDSDHVGPHAIGSKAFESGIPLGPKEE